VPGRVRQVERLERVARLGDVRHPAGPEGAPVVTIAVATNEVPALPDVYDSDRFDPPVGDLRVEVFVGERDLLVRRARTCQDYQTVDADWRSRCEVVGPRRGVDGGQAVPGLRRQDLVKLAQRGKCRAFDTLNGRVTVRYLATGASTNGEFGVYRWDMGAEPTGPTPHFHKTVSESFFVLSGTVRLFNGERWIDATAGDFLFVPEGGIHAFRNESGKPASMLLLFAPGAPREPYFEFLDAVGRSSRQLTQEEWTAFYREHDTYWV